MKLDFESQQVVVTGGTRGIGAAISRAFLDAGATVTALFGKNADAARSFQEQVSSPRLSIRSVDVSDPAAVDGFFDDWERELHVVVNNAGIRDDAIVGMMTRAQWDKVLDTNLGGTFQVCKRSVRLMSRARYGRIINVTSPSGRLGLAGQANYAASKAGQVALSISLAREVATRNITVNCVSPGFVETDLLSGLDPEVEQSYRKMVPIGRFAKPEEIAPAVLFLASRAAGYVTGAVLEVSGGL
ncbi:MAG: SDR family oxidoreductase [Myxococcales bacterium]|nr:SDR family oxidoreductase [Myxococcales bacterium]